VRDGRERKHRDVIAARREAVDDDAVATLAETIAVHRSDVRTRAAIFAGPRESGIITLALTVAANTPGSIAVDSPMNDTTGVAGLVAVPGWALDDIGITRMSIWRDPVAGENPGALVFIGNAIFLDGARPDVQAGFPGYPRNTRAGSGYMILTNLRPRRQRHGHAARHRGGCRRALRRAGYEDDHRRPTRAFDHAVGATDSPRQGEVVCGTIINFGWALTQRPTASRRTLQRSR
jgi:hypothetical protein